MLIKNSAFPELVRQMFVDSHGDLVPTSVSTLAVANTETLALHYFFSGNGQLCDILKMFPEWF